MRAQVSMEFLLGTAVWLAFIAIIVGGLLVIANGINERSSAVSKTITVDKITSQLEAMQATGFTTYVKVEKHKLNGNMVILDDNGKAVSAKTIYGVDEVYGQPQ